MRTFLLTVLGTVIGIFLTIFLMFLLIAGIGKSLTPKPDTTSSIVLELDLTSGLADHASPLTLFSPSNTVVDVALRLQQAKDDERVKGVFIRANPYGMSPAKAEEIALALHDFKTSGKFIITHAQGFEGTSLSNYFAVTPSTEIWVQDTAGFSVAGYRAETPFYGGVVEKFEAEAQFEQFREYKSAANSYTQKDYTPAHRESTTALMQSLYDTGTRAIASDRNLTIERVNDLLAASPHSAEAAKEAGLIDTLGHYAAARAHALEKGGDGAKFKPMSDYALKYIRGSNKIAIIGGDGTILTGKSNYGSPFTGGATTIGSDTISESLTKAAENDNVKAIVLRINSGGGSAIASDQMWDAVNRAKEAGKPVIVSMGQYAASGGYYMAASADKIVAMPTTITGSIGVLGGKIVLDGTYGLVGYNVEPITVGGPYAAAYSAVEPWNQDLRQRYRSTMEDIYVDFTTRVAEGRGLTIEAVEEIAKGRVWTGVQALDIGLVDEQGGIIRAIELAKEAADIDADRKVGIIQYPAAKTDIEQIQSLFGVTVESAGHAAQLRKLLMTPEVQAMLKLRRDAALRPEQRSLVAPLPVIE